MSGRVLVGGPPVAFLLAPLVGGVLSVPIDEGEFLRGFEDGGHRVKERKGM